MFHYLKSYALADTFPSDARDRQDLECVEMDSELPFYAASVQTADGDIRWLLLAGPSALARAHAGLAQGFEGLAVYQFKPNFEDGIELCVKRVEAWDSQVRVVTRPYQVSTVTDGPLIRDVHTVARELLMPPEP